MKSLRSSDGTTIEVSREASKLSDYISAMQDEDCTIPCPVVSTEALQDAVDWMEIGKKKESFLARGELDEVTSDTFDLIVKNASEFALDLREGRSYAIVLYTGASETELSPISDLDSGFFLILCDGNRMRLRANGSRKSKIQDALAETPECVELRLLGGCRIPRPLEKSLSDYVTKEEVAYLERFNDPKQLAQPFPRLIEAFKASDFLIVEGLRILLAAKLAEIVQQHTKDLDVNHTSPSIFELFGYTVSAKESDKEGHEELCSHLGDEYAAYFTSNGL